MYTLADEVQAEKESARAEYMEAEGIDEAECKAREDEALEARAEAMAERW